MPHRLWLAEPNQRLPHSSWSAGVVMDAAVTDRPIHQAGLSS